MKNTIKLAFILSVLSVSQIASALCTTELGNLPQNHSPFFASSNGGFCDTKAEANVQVQQVIGVQQVRQVAIPAPTVINTMPAGYGYRNCTAEESIRRAGLITAGGGLVGLLLRDNGRAAGTGAGLGLLYAMGTDCKVAVPLGAPPATVLGPREQSVTQSNCNVGNVKDIKGISAEDCKRLRDAMTVNIPGHCIIGGVSYPEFIDNEPGCRAKWKEIAEKGNSVPIAQASVPESAPKVSQLQQAPSAPLPWGYMPPTATPSNPAKCFVTSPVSGEKQGCATITVVKPLDGETRGSWQARVSAL